MFTRKASQSERGYLRGDTAASLSIFSDTFEGTNLTKRRDGVKIFGLFSREK